jgi:hypothetical protein
MFVLLPLFTCAGGLRKWRSGATRVELDAELFCVYIDADEKRRLI